MTEKIRIFWSPEIEAEFDAAYGSILKRRPVPYEELYIPTRFRDTHVVARASKDSAPLILLHPAGGNASVPYTLVTLAALAFVWFLNYWNLLGFRY